LREARLCTEHPADNDFKSGGETEANCCNFGKV